jgi:hypothetical protein
VRLFDTGHHRKTDAFWTRTRSRLRMHTDRRDELARQRVQTVNRLR